jgi:antitoxin MazE
MKAVVKKWGNSASVRIPSAVLQAAKLRLEDSVDVREESGRIVIEPVPRKEYDLSELLKRITPENLDTIPSRRSLPGRHAAPSSRTKL